MEFKLFSVKSVSMSKILGTEMIFSSSFINSVSMIGCKEATMQFFSCRGTYPKASYSSIPQNTIKPIVGEEILYQSYPYRVNDTNGSSMYHRNARVLDVYDDEYNGVIVHSKGLPSNPTAFASILRSSLSHWKAKGKKGVWLKLPITKSKFVPVAVKEGFQHHHAEREYVMMIYWIPEEPCLLPSNASHQVGVGGFVINERDGLGGNSFSGVILVLDLSHNQLNGSIPSGIGGAVSLQVLKLENNLLSGVIPAAIEYI